MFYYDIKMVNGSLEYRIYTIYYSTASAMPLLHFLFFFFFFFLVQHSITRTKSYYIVRNVWLNI